MYICLFYIILLLEWTPALLYLWTVLFLPLVSRSNPWPCGERQPFPCVSGTSPSPQQKETGSRIHVHLHRPSVPVDMCSFYRMVDTRPCGKQSYQLESRASVPFLFLLVGQIPFIPKEARSPPSRCPRSVTRFHSIVIPVAPGNITHLAKGFLNLLNELFNFVQLVFRCRDVEFHGFWQMTLVISPPRQLFIE